jgi:electron transfer flavoprotein beta subunit
MRIVVCIKQIIDPEIPSGEFKVDFDAKKAVDDQGEWVLSPYDENAIEVALQLKDQDKEIQVTALTMGGETSQKILRHAMAMGCDDAIWVKDPAFDALDSYGTAKVIAAAIQKAGVPDIVLCGRQAGDWDMGQVGSLVAEELGLACVTMAFTIEPAGDTLSVKREIDCGTETLKAQMPVLAAVTNASANLPRFSSVKGIMMANRKEIVTWSAQDLEITAEIEPLVVVEDISIPSYDREVIFIDGEDGPEKAVNLANHLIQMNLLR